MRTLAKLLCIAALVPTMSYAETTPTPPPQPDKLRDALVEMVTSVTHSVGEGKAFLVEKSPEFFREYLAWELFKNYAWLAVTGGLMLLCVVLSVSFFRAAKRNAYESGPGMWFATFAIVFLFSTVFNTFDVVKIKIAPQVYLVEYAKSLVK